MPLPDAVRCVAACAPGKRVTVVTPDGKSYALPIAPDPEPAAEPHPLVAASAAVTGAGASVSAGGGAVSGHVLVGPPGYASAVPRPQQRALLHLVGGGHMQAGRAAVQGEGQVSWEDQNELELLLLAA